MIATAKFLRAAALLFIPIALSVSWVQNAHADKIEFGDGNVLYGNGHLAERRHPDFLQ